MKVYLVWHFDLEDYGDPDLEENVNEIEKGFLSKENATHYIEKELDRIYTETKLEDPSATLDEDWRIEFERGRRWIFYRIQELKIED